MVLDMRKKAYRRGAEGGRGCGGAEGLKGALRGCNTTIIVTQTPSPVALLPLRTPVLEQDLNKLERSEHKKSDSCQTLTDMNWGSLSRSG